MRVPELEEVWSWCDSLGHLRDLAHVGKGLDFINEEERKDRGLVAHSTRRFRGAVRGFKNVRRDLQIHELPERLWLNIDADVVKTERTGSSVGVPQVLLNYARVSRGPWRLKAVIDRDGHAVTSRFLTVRPRHDSTPLEFLWAMCNSPVANAYMYTHSMKRDNLTGTVRDVPVPSVSAIDMARVAEAVHAYLNAVGSPFEAFGTLTPGHIARQLLLRVDAEVLRLYDLPPRLERQMLDLFAGAKGCRLGVPFAFDRYYPEGYEPCFPLHEYLSQDYARSTAGDLRERHQNVAIPAVLAALRRAVGDLEE